MLRGQGNPIPPAYLGFVANRGKVPDAVGGGNLQSMSRSRHIAMDTIPALQLVFAGYTAASGSETAAAAAVGYKASIEYPAGTTPTRITFAGAAQGSCPAGGTLFSDLVTLPASIPRGATFYVRIYQTIASSGIVYSQAAGLNNPSGSAPPSGEWWNIGASGITDVTGSTTNQSNGVAQTTGMQVPLAILGYTSRSSILITGDSRGAGFGSRDIIANSIGGTGEIARTIGKRFGSVNVCASGETMANAAGGALSQRMLLAQYCTHVICGYGINDFTAGQTGAQVLANLQTFAGLFSPTKPFIACTVSPKSASTDGWGTTTNQTADATSNANRISYNDTLRRGNYTPPITGVVDIAAQTESGTNSGLWVAAQRSATDCSITTGTAVLTSTALAKFTPDDVGKEVSVIGAGTAGGVLTTFINTYTSATSVTLGANAGTTVGPTATAYIGVMTNDGLHADSTANVLIENSTAFGSLNMLG